MVRGKLVLIRKPRMEHWRFPVMNLMDQGSLSA